MSDIPNFEKDLFLNVDDPNDHERVLKIGHALSSEDRLKIVRSLLDHSMNLSELSEVLGMPISSVSRHIDALADAGLIHVNYQPGLKGHTKFAAMVTNSCTVSFHKPADTAETREFSVELPVGMFSNCHIKPPCGMTGKDGFIAAFDDPNVFFSPERINAECVWFDTGFISYNFPTEPLRHSVCTEISFSFEICSETVFYNNNWPSDITVSINGIEVATIISPGDFGGRRGRYTPRYWSVKSTQFGMLRKVTINGNGVYVDNVFVHKHVVFDDLKLYDGSAIKLTIGIKEDAVHRGGINIFGRNFGDFPQAIVMTVK